MNHTLFQHLLPLPGFLVLSSNLWEHFVIGLNSRPITIPMINVSMPCIIAYIIGNMLTQWVSFIHFTSLINKSRVRFHENIEIKTNLNYTYALKVGFHILVHKLVYYAISVWSQPSKIVKRYMQGHIKDF